MNDRAGLYYPELMARAASRPDTLGRVLIACAVLVMAAWLAPAALFVKDLGCGGADGNCPSHWSTITRLLIAGPILAAALTLVTVVRAGYRTGRRSA